MIYSEPDFFCHIYIKSNGRGLLGSTVWKEFPGDFSRHTRYIRLLACTQRFLKEYTTVREHLHFEQVTLKLVRNLLLNVK